MIQNNTCPKRLDGSRLFQLLIVSLLLVAIAFSTTSQDATGQSVIVDPANSSWPKDDNNFPPQPPSGGGGGGSSQPIVRPPDPALSLSCTQPRLKIALMIDRSNSIIAESGPNTPVVFKNGINSLLDQIYARFQPNLKLDVLLYAFGTKSVRQNDRDANGNWITDASTPSGLQAIKQNVRDIYFRNDEAPGITNNPLFQSGSPTSEALDKAYNAGVEQHQGPYGLTNWHDAFVEVMKDAKRESDNGKKIDLAIMLTDGIATVWNGDSNVWSPVNGPSYPSSFSVVSAFEKNYWGNRYRSSRMVDRLRSGENYSIGGMNLNGRQPMSVRGILIRPDRGDADYEDQAQYARTYADRVFGDDYYFFSKNFDADLSQQIASLIQDVSEDVACSSFTNPNPPGIKLEADPNNISVEEGRDVDVRFTITNLSQSLVTSLKLCFGQFNSDINKCLGTSISLPNLSGNATNDSHMKTYSIELGSMGVEQTVTAYGIASVGNGEPVSSQVTVKIDPIRVALPS